MIVALSVVLTGAGLLNAFLALQIFMTGSARYRGEEMTRASAYFTGCIRLAAGVVFVAIGIWGIVDAIK